MPVSFLWPALLWGLLLVPVVLGVYVWALRRPPRAPLAFPDGSRLAFAAAAGRRWARHLPAALFLFGLAAALAAAARPVALLPVPADQSAIMLSLDVSGSMRSQDIAPSRMEASKAAAKAFVEALPARVRVGLTMFGGYAQVVVPPVTDHQRVIDAIDGLGFIRRTAIGEGLIDAVGGLPGRVRPAPDGTMPAQPPGPRPPAVVILLSDGVSNTGIDPLEAAQLAKAQEVTVYTVGIGQPMSTGTWTIGGPLDEETMKEIADIAGGQYFHTSSAAGLRDVYRNLARAVGWERRREEVSGMAAGLGALALIAALALSRLAVHPIGV
ncbi:MAG TPA: VWA domain-containing protein [bacterium]|nr:VWA domain-containing protein [bacterium]